MRPCRITINILEPIEPRDYISNNKDEFSLSNIATVILKKGLRMKESEIKSEKFLASKSQKRLHRWGYKDSGFELVVKKALPLLAIDMKSVELVYQILSLILKACLVLNLIRMMNSHR